MKTYITLLMLIVVSCSKVELYTDELPMQSNNQQIEILSNGDTLVTLQSGMRVVKMNGKYIYQGDIVLTEEQIALLNKPITRSGFVNHWSKKWSNQTVYYAIADDFMCREELSKAITHIQARTNLIFLPRTVQPDYVMFINGAGVNRSSIGKTGGCQNIEITSNYYGIIIHEIGHAIGLFHEQSRPDRDSYMTILYYNIIPEKRHNFDIDYSMGISAQTTPFDFGSIMMYGPRDFSIDGSLTIVAHSGYTYNYQRESLSNEDIIAINRHMYPEEKWYVTGPTGISVPGEATYSVAGPALPTGASVQWELDVTSGVSIISGQGTNTICVRFTAPTYCNVKATINFSTQAAYPAYSRPIRGVQAEGSMSPVVTDITMIKYAQGPGEYILGAVVTDPTSTCSWSSGSNTRLYELPYPDDAIFSPYPNLYKAIDFYSTGSQNITVTATNQYGNSNSFTKTFDVSDSKNSYSMRISPNPVNQGGSVNLTLNETPAQERIITLYTVELYNSGKQIVYQKTINENTTQLNLSSLNKGKYNVVVKKNGIIHTTQLLTVI